MRAYSNMLVQGTRGLVHHCVCMEFNILNCQAQGSHPENY